MPKEIRRRQMNFAVTDSEYETIRRRMAALGIRNQSAFFRKSVLNGYIIRLDFQEIRELIRLLGIMTNNINQIAKRENAGGHIYETELYEIQENQRELGNVLRQILTKLDGFN